MGFLEGFLKIVQGKPVFDEGVSKTDSAYHDERGAKIYPELTVERTDCHTHGSNMRVYAHIKNDSEFPLILDRLRFLNSDKQMPSDLSVGEVMQYLVYDGPRPKAGANPNFEMTYCNEARDYFSAMYYAEFKPEADGTFSVLQFRRQRQVKDI